MPPTPNPYQSVDLEETTVRHTSESGDWIVRNHALYCGPDVVLPEICYSTLATTNLGPYDWKLKYSSPIITWTWVIVACALFVGDRLFDFSLAISLAGAGLLLVLFVVDKLTAKSIRLRLHESQVIGASRRRRTLLSRVIMGSFLLVGVGLFLAMMDMAASSSVIVVVFFLAAMGAFFLPDLLLTGHKAPQLTLTECDTGRFRVDGLNPEFIEALTNLSDETWPSAGSLSCTQGEPDA